MLQPLGRRQAILMHSGISSRWWRQRHGGEAGNPDEPHSQLPHCGQAKRWWVRVGGSCRRVILAWWHQQHAGAEAWGEAGDPVATFPLHLTISQFARGQGRQLQGVLASPACPPCLCMLPVLLWEDEPSVDGCPFYPTISQLAHGRAGSHTA